MTLAILAKFGKKQVGSCAIDSRTLWLDLCGRVQGHFQRPAGPPYRNRAGGWRRFWITV